MTHLMIGWGQRDESAVRHGICLTGARQSLRVNGMQPLKRFERWPRHSMRHGHFGEAGEQSEHNHADHEQNDIHASRSDGDLLDIG